MKDPVSPWEPHHMRVFPRVQSRSMAARTFERRYKAFGLVAWLRQLFGVDGSANF
ncbi:MAG: hypothetical protein RB191_02185 [Terriglobia bacterium]|nr:hypothetical protein [Terriglobia bacterium]